MAATVVSVRRTEATGPDSLRPLGSGFPPDGHGRVALRDGSLLILHPVCAVDGSGRLARRDGAGARSATAAPTSSPQKGRALHSLGAVDGTGPHAPRTLSPCPSQDPGIAERRARMSKSVTPGKGGVLADSVLLGQMSHSAMDLAKRRIARSVTEAAQVSAGLLDPLPRQLSLHSHEAQQIVARNRDKGVRTGSTPLGSSGSGSIATRDSGSTAGIAAARPSSEGTKSKRGARILPGIDGVSEAGGAAAQLAGRRRHERGTTCMSSGVNSSDEEVLTMHPVCGIASRTVPCRPSSLAKKEVKGILKASESSSSSSSKTRNVPSAVLQHAASLPNPKDMAESTPILPRRAVSASARVEGSESGQAESLPARPIQSRTGEGLMRQATLPGGLSPISELETLCQASAMDNDTSLFDDSLPRASQMPSQRGSVDTPAQGGLPGPEGHPHGETPEACLGSGEAEGRVHVPGHGPEDRPDPSDLEMPLHAVPGASSGPAREGAKGGPPGRLWSGPLRFGRWRKSATTST